jgi:hypothetical protein
VTLAFCKSLGPGLRRDDDVLNVTAKLGNFSRTTVDLRRNDEQKRLHYAINYLPDLLMVLGEKRGIPQP